MHEPSQSILQKQSVSTSKQLLISDVGTTATSRSVSRAVSHSLRRVIVFCNSRLWSCMRASTSNILSVFSTGLKPDLVKATFVLSKKLQNNIVRYTRQQMVNSTATLFTKTCKTCEYTNCRSGSRHKSLHTTATSNSTRGRKIKVS